MASGPSVNEWLARTRRRTSTITAGEMIRTLDGQRSEWPDTDR
jgi:hypothetical protein